MIAAVIPCRSGSVGVKNKNIRKLAGRPLMSYAILPALESKYIDEVVVSTDSRRYADVARKLGAKVPFLRPRDLAEDVPTEKVITHAVRWLEENKGWRINPIVTLQCTTPLMKTEDIDACISAVLSNDVDSAMTVCEISERPEWMFKLIGGVLEPYTDVPLKGDWGVRQALEPLYRPTGACYVTTHRCLVTRDRIIGSRCRGIVVPRERSVDIDTELDLLVVKTIVESGTMDVTSG